MIGALHIFALAIPGYSMYDENDLYVKTGLLDNSIRTKRWR